MTKILSLVLSVFFLVGSNNTIEKTSKEYQLEEVDSQLISILENENLDKNVRLKFKYLVQEVKKRNLNNNLIVISTHRNEVVNGFLPLAAKQSWHIHGKAIDVLVGDMNGDGKANEVDVNLVVDILNHIEKKHPKLVGGIGTYKNRAKTGNAIKDVFIEKGKQMVHFDTRGTYARW